MAGLATQYGNSHITDAAGSRQETAKGVVVGTRFPSTQVVRFCDYKAVQLLSVLRSDGRWRIIVFGGDITNQENKKRLQEVTPHSLGLGECADGPIARGLP